MGQVAYITGAMLAYAREGRRVSVRSLAASLNIKPETLIAWESGKRLPSYSKLEKLAEILEFPFGMFWLSEVPNKRHKFLTRKEYRDISKRRFEYRSGSAQ